MQDTYLLDTSAFRALSAAQLKAASQEASLLVSPFCFWELLTHLEESGQFSRVKGNLMKFRHVQVLDDPRAWVERGVVLPSDEVHERLRDDELLYATLAALRDSDSVADFYQKYIRDSRNQFREISDCVSRVNAVLTAEEQRFEEFVKKIMAGVRGGVVRLTTPTEWHDRIIEMIDGWWLQLGDRVVESFELRDRFVSRMYLYSAYILRRAVEYVNRGAIHVDPNDFEDGRFCQHLALDSQMNAVTADSGLRRCLQEVLALVNRLPDSSYRTALRVCDVAELTKISSPKSIDAR
jgi:hypothetical protein